ncbi:MAG: selenocysteine-specific translation elongation factor [Candidatus Hydrogenedentes bacterium]|nr:selenocysteine-specific translation elongation factor [Candidatus Hydrogenedentota bacterium]
MSPLPSTVRRPPGLLTKEQDPDVVMMVCTAGHVDHGKTSLVKLLTGCNTDKLKAEQDRGMTIELGFAPCFLGGNECVGIVDVPGHESFIRNMVAGVSGIDLCVLVIAADDGIMPQTVEHVQIMELLGVRRGIVALTKIDLVPEEMVAQRVEEIAAYLQTTFLAGSSICPVSSETGAGFFEFYDVLVKAIRSLQKQRREGVFRMPIERSFLQPGFGAIVTGVAIAGRISVGDAVEIVPGHRIGKVRGMQRFLRSTGEAEYAQCLALNIAEPGKEAFERGQIVSLPGYLRESAIFHVRIQTVSEVSPPLRNAEAIKFHIGTAEEVGKVYLLEDAELGASASALATIQLNRPVAAVAYDRFILRRASPHATIAGGRILDIVYEPHRPPKKHALEILRTQEAFLGIDSKTLFALDTGDETFAMRLIQHRLKTVFRHGATADALAHATVMTPAMVERSLDALVKEGSVSAMGEGAFIDSQTYRESLDEVVARLNHARDVEGAMTVTLSALRQSLDWPDALWKRVRRELEDRKLAEFRGNQIVLQGAESSLRADERLLLGKILGIYREQGFHSPRPEELPELTGGTPAQTERLLEFLCHDGRLVRLAKNVVLSREHCLKAQELVISIIQEKGVLDSADFKYAIDSSRKYALSILDFFDARHVTVRQGNDRKLAPNYQRNVLTP